MALLCAPPARVSSAGSPLDDANDNTAGDEDLSTITIPKNADQRKWRNLSALFAPLAERVTYVVGTEVVGERTWFQNGKLAEKKVLRKGKLHGIHRQFHENGKPFLEIPYRDGLVDGTARFWDETGRLLAESTLANGTGKLRTFRHPVHVSFDEEVPFVNGKVHGWLLQWGNFEGSGGHGVAMTHYVNGKIDGWEYVYDDDGTFLGSGFSKNGKGHGATRRFNRQGKPVKRFPKYYVEGKEVSEQEFFRAAKDDPQLQESLHHVPDPPPELVPKKRGADETLPGSSKKAD